MTDISDTIYERQARLCQTLTDPKRLKLLQALRAGERSVGDLTVAIDASSTNVSQHLAVLRDAGLVATRRQGTSIYYRLAYPAIMEACDIIHGILRTQLVDAAALIGRAQAESTGGRDADDARAHRGRTPSGA